MEKLPTCYRTLYREHRTLLLRQDGANASLPNGLGLVSGERLPFADFLDLAFTQKLEDTVPMIGGLVPSGQLADRARHFGLGYCRVSRTDPF